MKFKSQDRQNQLIEKITSHHYRLNLKLDVEIGNYGEDDERRNP